ncbi:MAG: hypothetical protein AUI47_05535 [Acidobacteria bacterium 13_1_40CM_2_68_5]|nr:MAG: hypothetical protein AUI47_05535 [Acidobacteria bacterium 13_1_40CM_2_68_5]
MSARRRLATRDHVVADKVSKVYGDGDEAIEAVREISFGVPAGGFLSLVGPSGCGKSTFLMMVAGILPPTGGQIAIDGEPVHGPRRDIALLFQTPVLLPWRTVLENVLFPVEILRLGKDRYRDRACALLENTGLLDFKDRLPEQLSGGMRQRVSICRALISDPKILLMDEPFSALDALTRDEMNIELLRIWERFRTTVILVTHNIRESVFLSDRVIVMSPRPASIVRDFSIDLPRPRTVEMQSFAEFDEYCVAIRSAITSR